MNRTPYLFIINGAILTGCAVFFDVERSLWLIGLMFFLPLLDKNQALPEISLNPSSLIHSTIIALACLLLLLINPDHISAAITTFVFAALPEEWFFRAYFMTRLQYYFSHDSHTSQPDSTKTRLNLQSSDHESKADLQDKKHLFKAFSISGYMLNRHYLLYANVTSSALFALLHTPTQGWFGLGTFFPALFYGWVYQKTQDLLLVILLHTLSNILFFIFISDILR